MTRRILDVSESTLEWIRDEFASAVQGFYDEPGAWESDHAVKQHDRFLRDVAHEIGVSYEAVVAAEATDYERKRMKEILGRRR